MAGDLYTDREHGPRPRSRTALDNRAWRAIAALLQGRLRAHAFGIDYPEVCPDGGAHIGCDERSFLDALDGVAAIPEFYAEFRGEDWGEPADPPTEAILDALEWCAGKIGEPQVIRHHGFFHHDHLWWDRETGQRRFVEEVNQIFARNGLAFEMAGDCRIRRLVEGPSADALARALFRTGDATLDAKLERARQRFFDRDAAAGQEALEALWDAFERIKTLEDPDKRTGASRLLDQATKNNAPEHELLKAEMRALTEIGNSWQIRHHETNRHTLGEGRDLRDYLFLRLFSLIRLLLSRTGRLAHE